MVPLASPFHHLSQSHPESNVCGGPSGTRWSCSPGFRPCSELRASGSMSKGPAPWGEPAPGWRRDRKSTRLNSSHLVISYAVFCLKKKKITYENLHGFWYEF